MAATKMLFCLVSFCLASSVTGQLSQLGLTGQLAALSSQAGNLTNLLSTLLGLGPLSPNHQQYLQICGPCANPQNRCDKIGCPLLCLFLDIEQNGYVTFAEFMSFWTVCRAASILSSPNGCSLQGFLAVEGPTLFALMCDNEKVNLFNYFVSPGASATMPADMLRIYNVIGNGANPVTDLQAHIWWTQTVCPTVLTANCTQFGN